MTATLSLMIYPLMDWNSEIRVAILKRLEVTDRQCLPFVALQSRVPEQLENALTVHEDRAAEIPRRLFVNDCDRGNLIDFEV